MGVGREWGRLSQETKDSYHKLVPAGKDPITKQMRPPAIAYIEDMSYHGSPSWEERGRSNITPYDYDVLSALRGMRKSAKDAQDSPFFDKGVVGSYEFVVNKNGDQYIHGNASVDGNTKDVYFKETYGSHKFGMDEIKSLLCGDEVDISSRSGKGCKVQLGSCSVNGHDYFGVKRIDVAQERRLPDVAEVVQSGKDKQFD